MTASLTLADWCVLLAALMPIVCAGIAKSGMFGKPRREGGYDNELPRDWLARQTDWRARANAAQANCFEALPFFIGAVVIAHQHGANQTWVNLAAVLFVLLRVAYVACYLSNRANARSAAWIAAMTVNVALLFIA
jgi:uncharacterized MAPEG superfamily protein